MTNRDEIEREMDEWIDIAVPTGEIPEGGQAADAPVEAPADEVLAERILYKVKKLTEELEEIRGAAQARRDLIDQFESDRSSGPIREIGRARQSLEAYARRYVRDHPRRSKTIDLAYGWLKVAKSGRGRIIVQDEYQFVEWAKKHRPDLLRWEPKVKKADLANEEVATRHPGPQIDDPEKDRTGLVQSYRLMVKVETLETMPGEPPETESVSVPGVIYVEPLEEKFTMDTEPRKDRSQAEEIAE